MRKKWNHLVSMILLLCMFVPIVHGQDYTSDSLSIEVYTDGSVDVEYVVEPDITLAQVNVSLLGDNYQDLFVVDQNGIILDWALSTGGIEVDSLGSTSITVSYSTDSLTDKTGSQWSISIDSDINVLYTLPTGAVLVGINPSPIGLTIVDNQAVITMPVGVSSITYLIGTTGTREHALVLLNTAKADVNEALDAGVMIDEAETFLTQAIQAYQDEEYAHSEQYSAQASESARETIAVAADALSQINAAEAIIEDKMGQIADETMNEAQNKLQESERLYEQGEYVDASQAAEDAYTLVAEAPVVEEGGNQLLFMAGAVIVVLIGAGYWYLNQQKESAPQRPDTTQPQVDLDMVFRKNPHLRTDDKAILRFLEETGGAFITEVREKFDIPKSSAWRMVRRLEEDGIIVSSKVGRETYLQLRSQEEEQ